MSYLCNGNPCHVAERCEFAFFLVRCEHSHIAEVRSKSIGELAHIVDLILYCNPCQSVKLFSFAC